MRRLRQAGVLIVAISAVVAGLGVDPAAAAPRPLPVITKLNPNAGPLIPTKIVLSGKHLSAVDAIEFGRARGTILRRLGSTSVEVRTPRASRPGTVPVRIHTKAGWSKVSTATHYTFAAAPSITKLSAGAGPLAPTRIVISGKNLLGATAVEFGRSRGVILRRLSATAVEVRTPTLARSGTVTVRVHTKAGWSATSSAARYTFVAPPTIAQLAPAQGSYSGGETVTLTGSHLQTTKHVTFGTTQATIVSKTRDKVVLLTPLGVLGDVAVRVTTIGGTSRPIIYTYAAAPKQETRTLAPVSETFNPSSVDWVTGGFDAESGVAEPWILSLPPGAAVPVVGASLLLEPGSPAFPSGLAGTVRAVAVQTDDTVRVTVEPTDMDEVFERLSLQYSGPVLQDAPSESPQQRAAQREVTRAVEFPIAGSALFCRDQSGRSVAVGADLSMRVTDVDVHQKLDLGRFISRPTYDGTLTAEVTTSGKIHAQGASTCGLRDSWAAMHRATIPLGTTGMTLSFAPAFEFTVSGAGSLTMLDRTRTTFTINVEHGRSPQLRRTSTTVESTFGGDLSFTAGLAAGVEVDLGVMGRAGVNGKLLLGVAVGVKAGRVHGANNVCVEGDLVLKLSVAPFLDVLVRRWQTAALTATVKLRPIMTPICTTPEPSPPSPEEPRIRTTRLPDAEIAQSYVASLETADARAGTWSTPRHDLPPGLVLAPETGHISGTPSGPVGDRPLLVQFVDGHGRAATTTVRLRIQPKAGLGGGDLQVTLRWSGPADLDLHVEDPQGAEIYYQNPVAASGGRLDHDANAGCNGPADDDAAVENVFWQPGSAPAGSYRAFVHVYAECDGPLNWHLTVRRNGVLIIDERGSGDSPKYGFDIGGSNSPSTAPAQRRTSAAYPPKKSVGSQPGPS